MKVKTLLLAAFLFSSLMMVNAQSPSFQKGDKVVNLGLGVGGYSPNGFKIRTPSLLASFEYALMDNIIEKGAIGVGGYAGYAHYSQKGYYAGDEYWTVDRIFLGVRGAFHYPLVDKLDTYGGLTLGITPRIWKWNGEVNNTAHPKRKPVAADLFAGGRYYISDKIAAMAEFALESYLTIGISLKL